ncbi:SH3 and PX domain-containing protein 2A [Hoplias malabaricus]|uniref:SH3 and PX domain-containing protein 2A n=1 Tax=Hoplias malabaricus TaxID=27720 RepID=UPI0034620E08
MQFRTISALSIVDVQKIRNPSKHYVFIISAYYSDGSSQLIYRRYNHFFNLQMKLMDMFPDEGGQQNPNHRIIPSLPGKVNFGRSQSRDVAVRRLMHLDNYCRALLCLPAHISQCEEVLKFFEPTPEDLKHLTENTKSIKPGGESREIMTGEECVCVFVVAADYQRQENTEISLRKGERVEVIEKNDTGWWFVSTADEQGWVPATYLVSPTEQQDDSHKPISLSVSLSPTADHYVTVQAYSSSGKDELGFECGVIVEVIQKNLEGWWFIRYGGKEGWAPGSYLRKVQDDVLPGNLSDSTETNQESTVGQVEIIGNLMEISNLLKRKPVNDTNTHSNIHFTNDTHLECDTNTDTHFSAKLETTNNTLTNVHSTHWTTDNTDTDDTTTGVDSVSTHTRSDTESISDSHTQVCSIEDTETPGVCRSVTNVCVGVSASESSVCSTGLRTHTPAIARVTPQRYHSVENGSPSYKERPPPRRENSLGFQLPQLPDPPSVDAEYYTIAEFHSCLGDGISFSGGEKAEVIKKNSGGWWYVQIGEKEGWAPCSYIDKRKKPSLNRKTSTLTRPKVPPPAPPIKKQTSLPCMESGVGTVDRSRVYEEPEYDVPAVGLDSELGFLPSVNKAPHSAPYWLGDEGQERNGEGQFVYDLSHSYSSSRGHQRPIWDPPEYDAPTIEFSAVSISQEQPEGSKLKPSVRPKPTNPEFSSLRRSLKPTNQLNQNYGRSLRTSAGSETDSTSSLDDSVVFKLSVSAESEVMDPQLSISAESEIMPSRMSVSTNADDTHLLLYRSTAEFHQGAPGELSLPAGVLVEVLEKQQSGWWFVRWGAQEGWVPTYFLKPITHAHHTCMEGGDSRSKKNEDTGQNIQGVCSVTLRTQHGNSNADVTKEYAAINKDRASVTNDYASVTKDKNGAAKENTSPGWKNESSCPQMTHRDPNGSGRSIPISMVKPKPQIIHNNLREEYVTMADYHGDAESMGFPAGTRLEVLEKNANGWWYCCTLDSSHTRRGWVPSNFLEKKK